MINEIEKYFPDMEVINSDIEEKIHSALDKANFEKYTKEDVIKALNKETLDIDDFCALLSNPAKDLIEEIAKRAKKERERYFGKNVYFFTPLYISNYCENQCVYCGFNCKNNIKRAKLGFDEIEKELIEIKKSGLEEILILTGESRTKSDVQYIGQSIQLAKKYFKNIGIEIYPLNTDEYNYLHKMGADYVTVFQETYDKTTYEKKHLKGHKRIYPYRLNSQERAILGGIRGVAFGALLGLFDYKKDTLATACHMYYLQKKYPHAEISVSIPRLRPTVIDNSINPNEVKELELLQIMCAYRIFMPFINMTISTRERADFRNNAVQIAATKISAGVSTGIGEHTKKEKDGDNQFEIADSRSVDEIYKTLENLGMQPIMNDYIYVG